MLREAANSSGALNRSANINSFQGPVKFINGQENRRPLLHRVFGGKQTATGGQTNSNSVGAVARGAISGAGYLGGSKQGPVMDQAPSAGAQSFASSHNSRHITQKEANKFGRLNNSSVVSAAPPSHPVMSQEPHKPVEAPQFMGQPKSANTSTERGSGVLPNRSLKRKFVGKDMQNVLAAQTK